MSVVNAGVDELAHVFIDKPPSREFVELCIEKGIFVIPTLSILGSLTGKLISAEIAKQPQVQSTLRQPS